MNLRFDKSCKVSYLMVIEIEIVICSRLNRSEDATVKTDGICTIKCTAYTLGTQFQMFGLLR